MAKHKLRIVKRDTEWIVVPGIAVLKVGDVVTWKAFKTSQLTVSLPPGIFSQNELKGEGKQVKRGQIQSAKVKATVISGAGTGYYDYSIQPTASKSVKAKGNSSPGIIID
jgi:hypothetical protein